MDLLGLKCTLVLADRWNCPSSLWTGHTGGGRSVTFYHKSDFPSTKLYGVQKRKQNWACRWGGHACAQAVWGQSASAFSAVLHHPGSQPRTVPVELFLDRGAVQVPRVGPTVHLLIAFIMFPQGGRGVGAWVGAHVPIYHTAIQWFLVYSDTCPSPQSTLEYFHYFKKGPLPFSYHSPIRHLPFPSTEQTTNLLLVSIDFPILDANRNGII